MQVVVPSTLLRACERFAVRTSDRESDEPSVRHGFALGVENADNSVAVWGVLRDLSASDSVLPSVVGGVTAIGAFTVWVRGSTGRDDDETAEQLAAVEIARQALTTTIVMAPRLSLIYVHETHRLHAFGSDATPLELEIVNCSHARDFISSTSSLLLRASLSFRADTASDITAWRTALEENNSTFFFQFPEQRHRVFSARGESLEGTTTLSTLVKMPEQRVVATSKTKKKKTSQFDNWDTPSKTSNGASTNGTDILTCHGETNATLYLKTLEYGDIPTVEVLHSLAFAPSMNGSPSLTLQVSSGESSPVNVHADALIVVSQSASVADVIVALHKELTKQLMRLEAEWTPTAQSLRLQHFGLVGTAFPVTLPTVDNVRAGSVPPSHTLAAQLLQPTNQPLFTPSSCSLVENATVLADMDILFNVHEGIPSSGVPHGTQYLVDGFYGYYHYLQQATNDKGWGCAYRSLQTLASWLYWNHYTQTLTLTHREIQQTLVAMGDKPAAFIGSREWIGSMEVGYVLDERFGISFRTLNVASGAQLVEQAQELKYHFETQGTPVMMGGGQLAFTVLGIDYNASTGDCAFLILDPHYVGAEDLETIQTKTMALEGYKAVPCGWRKASSFSKTSFYNLCLPQRPDKTE